MKSEFRAAMGTQMREKRKTLHLTQEQVAERLDISAKHYDDVERGNAGLSLENFILLSDLLGLNLDHLVKGGIPELPDVVPNRMIEIYQSSSEHKRMKIAEILEAVNEL